MCIRDRPDTDKEDKVKKRSRSHLPYPKTPEMSSNGKNLTTGQHRQGGAVAGSASPAPVVQPTPPGVGLQPPGAGVSHEAVILAQLVERMDGMAKVIGQVDGMEGRLVGKIDTRMDELEKKVDDKIGASMAKVELRISSMEGKVEDQIETAMDTVASLCLLYTSPSPRD